MQQIALFDMFGVSYMLDLDCCHSTIVKT